MDPSVHPPRVEHAHLELDGWLGDELIERYPCLFVTDDLAATLSTSTLGRYRLHTAEVTTVDEDLRDDERAAIRPLRWFVVTGTAGEDDIGLTATGRLVVSDRALTLLQQHNIDHCDILEYHLA
ncbi:hypothetical protein GCM10009675_40000 [Prauserella alba]|uniref:Uncharacterized protein n=1 Tax=Prauserella alba TaxID=176898 RepID=A0ABN1VJE0_9PSEU